MPRCAGFPCLPLTDASFIHGSLVRAACPFGMQPIAPCGLRDTLRPHSITATARQSVENLSTHQHCRCGRGEKKKTYQKQKCNLEAVLRGMTQLSNRLLVREWCLCVALPKPLMCMDTSLCGRSVPLMLNWTPEGDVGLWWDDGTLQPANQKKMWLCNKLLSSRITLLFYYFPVPASWPGCAVWKSQHSRTHIKQTLIRFIVGKSCPSRCLINKYVWTD